MTSEPRARPGTLRDRWEQYRRFPFPPIREWPRAPRPLPTTWGFPRGPFGRDERWGDVVGLREEVARLRQRVEVLEQEVKRPSARRTRHVREPAGGKATMPNPVEASGP
jgi:hypothetical protein